MLNSNNNYWYVTIVNIELNNLYESEWIIPQNLQIFFFIIYSVLMC